MSESNMNEQNVLLCLLALVGSCVCQSNTGPYYGLPLGGFAYNRDSTAGQVYAADAQTVVLVNFQHKPVKPGCTTLMAGPMPAGTPNAFRAPNDVDAILIPVPNKVRRMKRNSLQSAFFNSWPFELDNLRVNQPASNSNANQDPFAAIELDLEGIDESSSTTEDPRAYLWSNSRRSGTKRAPSRARPTPPRTRPTPPRTHPTPPRTRPTPSRTQPTTTTKAEPSGPSFVLLGAEKAGNVRTTTARATTRKTVVVHPPQQIIPTVRRRQPSRPAPTRRTQRPTTSLRTTQSRWRQRTPATTRRPQRTTPRATTPAPRPTTTTEQDVKKQTQAESAGGGLILADFGIRAPAQVHRAFWGRLPRLHEIKQENTGQLLNVTDDQSGHTDTSVTTAATTEAVIAHDVVGEGGYTAVFGRSRPPTPKPASRPTHGPPATVGAPGRHFDGLVFSLGGNAAQEDPTTRKQTTKQTTRTTQTVAETTQDAPSNDNSGEDNGRGWKVIEDPRAKLRKLRGPRPTLPPEFYRRPLTTPLLPDAPSVDQKFVLAESDGSEPLVVSIPNEFTIDQFKWFGIWDHCEKRRTAFVSTEDVKAPEEAVVAGLRGWAHNVESTAVHVLNCNTLLVKDFQYTGFGATEAFFYVGIGEFPQYIVHQQKATVVGALPDAPLRNYRREDVMVRLPRGWKTFDINFLSVFNADERVSFGHAVIPPVIVPPCEDLAPPPPANGQ